MHTRRERVWASPLMRRNSEEAVKSLIIGQFFRVFVYLWPITWFLFPHLTCPRTLPNLCAQLFSKMDSGPEAYGGPWHHLFWVIFDPQGASLHRCNVSLAPRMGNLRPLDLLLKQGLAPLCSCHDCYLKVSTGDKVQLFTLFLLLFLSRSADRRLVIYI